MPYVKRILLSSTLNGTLQSHFRLVYTYPAHRLMLLEATVKDMKQKHGATDHSDITNEDISHQNEEVQTFRTQKKQSSPNRSQTSRRVSHGENNFSES